ncbi:MAG TPA: riboflavin synthase [Dehalococcoidia bacterium]|nr:riboflavin synthase [Dehalococcoidia bacterium]
MGIFTGIIEEVGTVLAAERGRLRIACRSCLEGTRRGDSIAVNGVDLTVAEMDNGSLYFHVMPETYRRTNLSDLAPGDPVNLERALTPLSRLSGHLVRGVVEATGTVLSLEAEEDAVIVRYSAPPEVLRYVVVKGPIAVDGVSLTVIQRWHDSFAVSLVRYTQEHTNLVRRRPGQRVNLETDILARYVDQMLRERPLPGG